VGRGSCCERRGLASPGLPSRIDETPVLGDIAGGTVFRVSFARKRWLWKTKDTQGHGKSRWECIERLP